MNGFLGADTEALREVGARFEERSLTVEDMTARLSALIDAVPWVGPDAMALRVDWAGRVRPHLVVCRDRLREDGRSLRDHAEEQDQVSEIGGDAGGGADRGTGAGGRGTAELPVLDALPIRLASLVTPLGTAADAAERIGEAAGDVVDGIRDGAGRIRDGVSAVAQEISEAIGTDSPLAYDGSGLVLEPPRTTDTVRVDTDHELAPDGAASPFGLDAQGAPLELAPSTRYQVGDHGTFYTDGDGEVVYIEATGGGDRMNPNLREVFPDANYHVNENVYYSTDELGRLDHMYVPEVELHPDTSRSQSIQSKIAERFDMSADGESRSIEFNAGHALARQFGGVREEINYTRQWDDVNQARSGVDDNIYAYESLMADGIKDYGHRYSYENRITWDDHQPPGVGPEHDSAFWEYVPSGYDVRITENGEEIARTHMPNYPDGATFDE